MTVDKSKMDVIFKTLKKSATVGILLQPSPDPDALGSAAGFAVLLKEIYKLKSKIFHFGEVSHPQNKSMKNILHISLEAGEDFDPENVSATVVLDTDLVNTGFLCEKLPHVNVRIDHHSMERDSEPQLEDVRPVGATCSIIWEYLQEYEIRLEDHTDAATAMLLGIKTDTLDFTSANTTELDLKAYRSLLSHVNRDTLAKLTNFTIPRAVFETEAKAFKEKDSKGTTLVSFVGETTPQHRDIIPSIADRFSRMDGVNTVIILGIIENHLVASVRSRDSRVDVHDLCVTVFGKENAGAKEGSDGARVPLGLAAGCVEDPETKANLLNEVVASFKERIFDTLGEE